MRQKWFRFGAALLGSYAMLAGACGGIKFDGMFFNPAPSDGRYPWPSDLGDVEELRLHTTDGEKLQAFFVKPTTWAADKVTVLYSHGNKHHIGEYLDRVVRLVRDLQWQVLVYDYRGYGVSSGEPSPAGIRIDARTAWQAMRNRSDVDQTRVVLYGYSLGAHATLSLAANLDPADRPLAVVVESAFASGQELIRDGVRLDLPRQWVLGDAMDNLGPAAAVRSPILVLHGLMDTFIHPDHGRKIYGAVRGVEKAWVPVHDADHGNVPDRLGRTYAERLRAWIADAIAP